MPINNAMHSLSSQTNGIGGEHGERDEGGVKMLRAGSNINQLTKYAISKHLLFEGPKHKKENMSFWKQATVLEISRNIFGISSYERFLRTMTILLVVGNSMYKILIVVGNSMYKIPIFMLGSLEFVSPNLQIAFDYHRSIHQAGAYLSAARPKLIGG